MLRLRVPVMRQRVRAQSTASTLDSGELDKFRMLSRYVDG
jgi:hypothetical protein